MHFAKELKGGMQRGRFWSFLSGGCGLGGGVYCFSGCGREALKSA